MTDKETEDRLEEIQECYLEDLHANVNPNRESIVAAFPELGEPLNRRLRFVDLVFQAGKYKKLA